MFFSHDLVCNKASPLALVWLVSHSKGALKKPGVLKADIGMLWCVCTAMSSSVRCNVGPGSRCACAGVNPLDFARIGVRKAPGQDLQVPYGAARSFLGCKPGGRPAQSFGFERAPGPALPRCSKEILEPTAPMALRLRATLVAGVFLIYKRQQESLLVDVQRMRVRRPRRHFFPCLLRVSF